MRDPFQHPTRPEPRGLAAARRARTVAQLALLAWLAYGGAGGCGPGEMGPHQGELPKIIPAEFKGKLSALVAGGKLTEATRYLRETDPIELAKAASMRGDVRYFVIMGIGPSIPGIDPKPEPARKWTLPGTSDMVNGEDDRIYQLAAYDFAKVYNESLAKFEGRVK
jgi:hypothetical protein